MGGKPFVQKFPGSERAPTLAEVQEIQRRLTALGFDTGGTVTHRATSSLWSFSNESNDRGYFGPLVLDCRAELGGRAAADDLAVCLETLLHDFVSRNCLNVGGDALSTVTRGVAQRKHAE